LPKFCEWPVRARRNPPTCSDSLPEYDRLLFSIFDFPVRCISVAPQGREDRSPECLRSSAFWKSLAMVAGQQAVQAGRTCPKSSEEVLHPLMQEWALRCTELKAMKEWLAARRLSPRSRQSHFLRATTSVIFRREDGLSSLFAAIPRTHGIVGLLAHYFLRGLQYLIHGFPILLLIAPETTTCCKRP
jgi:hypothetical protein